MMQERGVEVDHSTLNRWGAQVCPAPRPAIPRTQTPEKITIDKRGANTAAIESYNNYHEAGIEIRQVKYLNNIVEQDHRGVKRLVRSCWGSNRSDQLT